MLFAFHRRFALLGFAFAALAFISSPAFAIESERLYSYKHWYVDVVTFDDGTLACEASVQGSDVSFSIWTYPDKSVELQFYLVGENFGSDATYRDISVRIDRRSPWDLSDAKFYKSSIFFTLPSDNWKVALRFLNEVKRGNKLYLFNRHGSEKAWYSLAGSSATMSKLSQCQDLIGQNGGW